MTFHYSRSDWIGFCAETRNRLWGEHSIWMFYLLLVVFSLKFIYPLVKESGKTSFIFMAFACLCLRHYS